jgi:hypothetical protein
MRMSRLYGSVVAVAVRLPCSHICYALVRREGAQVRQPNVSEGNALRVACVAGVMGKERFNT